MRSIFLEDPRHLAVDIERVADRIVAANLDMHMPQEPVVAHPVRKMMRHPGASLRAVVVSRRRSHQLREVVLPMHALGHVGDAELVWNPQPRMFLKLLPR